MHILNTSHRGNYSGLPENSLAGFRAALAHGAEAIELDVRLCATGEAVVVHDRTLRRIAKQSGRISRMTLAQLQRVNIGSHYPIGTLDALLADLVNSHSGRGPRVYIELKGMNRNLAQVAAETVRRWCETESYSYDRLYVISLNYRLLKEVKKWNALITTGLSTPPVPVPARLAVRWAQAIGASMVNPHYRFLTRHFVHTLQKNGLAVNVWPVNKPDDMRRVVAMGVDCIMTDDTTRLAEIIEESSKS